MRKQRAFRFKLKINSTQRTTLCRFAGCRRKVYNMALALQIERKQKGEKHAGYFELCKLLTHWRHQEETAFLAEAPTHPLQQGLKDLERAFTNFFERRAQFPRFRKRNRGDSFRYPDPKQFKLDAHNSRIYLPKLGWIRYRKSREIEGRIKQVTVSRSGDDWFVSVQTEHEVEPAESRNHSAIGIDLGVVRFATLSDGTKFYLGDQVQKLEKRIVRVQRSLARKVKHSGKWRKQVKRLRGLYQRIRDCRLDFHHKTSTTISKSHAKVIVEDLNVKGMSASASGTIGNPGTNVKAKSGLNRSILRQGWSQFVNLLRYKVECNGGSLLEVSGRNTSCTCSKCGFVSRENRKSQSKFECNECKYFENADLNAARNILAAGLAVKRLLRGADRSLEEAGTHRVGIIRKSFA